jgi:hypothetical protein
MARKPYLAKVPKEVYVFEEYKITRTGNPPNVYPQVEIDGGQWGEDGPFHDEVAELGLETDYRLNYRSSGPRDRGTKSKDLSRLREPLHVQFANWDDSLEGFIRFTKRFGWLDIHGGSDCYSNWLYRHRRFCQYWEWNGQESEWDGLAAELTEHLLAAVRQEVEPDTMYTIGGVFAVSESAVRFELHGHKLVPRLVPGSLWQHLLTLLADEQLGRLRICENSECPAPYFIARRADQQFCGSDCAGLVAKRRWWQEHGKEWRKKRRKSKKVKKKVRR